MTAFVGKRPRGSGRAVQTRAAAVSRARLDRTVTTAKLGGGAALSQLRRRWGDEVDNAAKMRRERHPESRTRIGGKKGSRHVWESVAGSGLPALMMGISLSALCCFFHEV